MMRTWPGRRCHSWMALLVVVVTNFGMVDRLVADELQWQEAYKVRTRVISGGVPSSDPKIRYAFVQIELEPGWKTYWRNPGEGGGIPPEFNWQGSKNLADAVVLFPAPRRLADPVGDTIGYQSGVTFPIRLTAQNAADAIGLDLTLRFGICKDICVPSEAKFNATIPANGQASLPFDARSVLESVPREMANLKQNDPVLVSVSKAENKGADWTIGLTTKHTAKARELDLFLEAPGGVFIPIPKRVADQPGSGAVFEIVVSDGEYQALRDKAVQATVVDSLGASQSEFILR